MLYRDERSGRIQLKGTGSEREREEQKKSRNMKNMRKRGKNAVEGRRKAPVADYKRERRRSGRAAEGKDT